ncbi:MAG: ABC transporter substrate-binding protein [Thermoprotei archaeon]
MNKRLVLLVAVFVIAALVISLLYIHLQHGRYKEITVRFAVEFNTHSSAFWVALDKGFFKEEGIRVEYKVYSTGLELAAALLRGEFDFAIACIGPLLIVREKGVPVKLVAMMHNHGYAILTSPKHNITNFEEVRNGKATASGPGSPTWLILELAMRKYNVSSLSIQRTPPFIATTMLLTGKTDIASLPEHYVSLAESMGAHVILTSREIWPDMPGSGLAVREEYLEKYFDIVLAVTRALAKAVEYINEYPDEAAKIVAKYLATDVGIIENSLQNMVFDIRIDEGEIEKYITYLVELGALSHRISVSEFIDKRVLNSIEYG